MFKESINLGLKKEPIEHDFEAEEKALAAAWRFDDAKQNKNLKNIWLKEYKQDPVSFFSEDNFQKLKLMDGSERLYLLACVSSSIMVTPEMAKEYYKEFPDDLVSTNIIFKDRRWMPSDKADYNLFTISALEADKDDLHEEEIVPGYKHLEGNIEQYYNIARRRQEAPKLLLSNFKEIGFTEDFKEFGKAADALIKVEKDATNPQYTANEFINAKNIFSKEYEKLPEESKALFLRKCLAQSQYHLLFEEVYNSLSTPESVKFFSENEGGYYNAAHSMVYKTYQPQKVYNYGFGAFDYEMSSTAERGGDVEEYAEHKIILAVLGKLKDVKVDQDENTKLVVEFWNKNRNPIFANAVADVLSEQNVNLAASQLLELLHSEKDKKEPINAMLYRLEFGKIGISDEGVKYLEKVYDLGEYNNPAYHANRLTVNGEIGVFNEELELIKYFHLGKLDSEDKKIKADVLDFAYETLFIGSDKENPKEREKREKYLEEFRKKYYQISEDDMFKNTNTRLNNLSFKEQGWFLIYFNQATEEEKNKLRDFVANYHEDGIKTFLSLEVDGGMGEKIIAIGEKLRGRSEDANLLFAKYTELAERLTNDVNSFEELYRNIFFDKNINRNELIKLSRVKANQLLSSFHENMEDFSLEESNKEIKLLINNLDREIIEKMANLEELRRIALTLNEKYNNLGQDLLVALDPEMGDYKQFEEDLLSNNNLTLELKDSIKDDLIKHKKYDSERLKEMILYYQEMAEVESYSPEIMQMVRKDFEDEKSKSGEEAAQNFNWSERMEKYSKESPQLKTEEQVVYEETIRKLQQVLPLQIALEKKVDQLVYGREEIKLPEGFSNFENSKVAPESIPEQAPLYFPVGISKDLPSWEAVLNGEKKAVKPIDLYGYLFWLNNQDRKVNLVICDEIQVNNYQTRYGKSESEARQKAGEIGNRETEQYEKIIRTFGLDNINIQRYQEFINGNKDEYERYSSVVKNLAIQPAFREAFLAMVQESVSGAEKEEYIGYALEELTWILSTNGTKIGHLNEARYDILGAVIRNFEQVGKEQGLDVLNNPESPEAKVILNTVCKITRDAINEKKSKLDKNSSSLAYFQRLQDHLGKIKIDSKAGYDKSVKKDSLSLNFVCPDVGSASFGFRGDFEAKESVVKFKEPYSTYFYKNDSDLLINSDQVVAASDGLIGGKILTLDNKKQLKYAESVVRPILKHYFASLEKAPAEYFEQVNKNREELLAEAQDATSLLEVLRFVQKYIVKPTQLV